MISSNGHDLQAMKIPIEHGRTNGNGEEFLSIEQLQHLVRLIDQSDVSELEVQYATKKARLVLRRARPSETGAAQTAIPSMPEEATPAPEQSHYTITSTLVGTFHPWSKAKEKPLITVGAIIQEGQHVGVIQSLDIPNEIESPVAGRVVEILVEDGQPVEYGQPLIIIDKHRCNPP